MKKRKVAMLLAAIMCFGSLAGCGSNEEKNDDTADGQAKPIKIMAPLLSETAPEENCDIEKALEELTGYEVEITWVPNSSYGDKLSITLASDDIPDILIATTGRESSIISAVKKGAFWQLDDYLDDYPELAKMNEEIKLNSSFNGDTYGIYRSRDVIRSGIIIRRDWLNNLGMEAPTTVDEFTEMLRAFKNNDPDGNGQDDTYGLTIPKWDGLNNNGPFDIIANWFGVPNVTEVDNKGNVTYDFQSEEYMEFLDYMKMLFDEGLINQDFAVLSTDDWNNDFISGRAGCIIDTQSRAMSIASLMAKSNGVEEGSEWVTLLGNVKSDNGDTILPTSGFAGQLMIPKQAVETEERLKEVLDFIDKTNTEEGCILLNKGIEGVHYTMENGEYAPLVNEDEAVQKQNSANLASFAQLGTGVAGYALPVKLSGTQLESERIAIRDGQEWRDKAVFCETSSLISDVATQKSATLNNIIADARIQYISGQIDKAGLEAEFDRWMTSGGSEVLEDLTKLYKENLLN